MFITYVFYVAFYVKNKTHFDYFYGYWKDLFK